MEKNKEVPNVPINMEKSTQLSDIKRSANWLYWIGGLSLVNTVMTVTNAGYRFLFGLGITYLLNEIIYYIFNGFPQNLNIQLDYSSNSIGWVGVSVIIVSNLLVCGIFVLLGFFANRGKKWAFIVGVILYGFDALLLIVFYQDLLGFAFHILGIYYLFNGFKALSKLRE